MSTGEPFFLPPPFTGACYLLTSRPTGSVARTYQRPEYTQEELVAMASESPLPDRFGWVAARRKHRAMDFVGALECMGISRLI